jgi:predicted cupin superfamily sugar epimerase
LQWLSEGRRRSRGVQANAGAMAVESEAPATEPLSRPGNPQTDMQFIEEQSTPRFVRLKPLAVNHHLRDSPLAHAPHDLIGGSGVGVDVDLSVGNPVSLEKLLGRPAISAPAGGIDLDMHLLILSCPALPFEMFVLITSLAMTAEQIKTLLQLRPHPIEGGHFRRTYTSAGTIQLPRGIRSLGTAIYYLLEPGTFSEMHVLDSDEMFHFYLGDPVEMLQLHPDGHSTILTLGNNLEAGQHVQAVVPAGVWQGSRLIGDGKVALLGCTVTPGFDFEDYRNASYAELAGRWPAEKERIKGLTRS